MADGAPPPDALAPPPPRDAVLIIIALLGVSLSGPLMAATMAPALAIAFWRTALGGGLTSLVVAVRARHELAGLDRRRWQIACLAGGFLALHFATWVPSLNLTSVAVATALVSTQPIFVAAIMGWQGVRIPTLAWVGIVTAVVGVAMITGADVSLSGHAVLGDVLALLGGLFAAAYTVVGGKARGTISAPVYTGICYCACAVGLLAACVVGRQELLGFSANAWAKIVAVTISAQLLGHTLFNVVLRTTSAAVVSIALLLETPGAALVAYFWLGQRPPASAWPGIVLLLASMGVVIAARDRRAPVEAVE
jgi:drug/metabolite transporter (DMT)-like permease